MYFFYDITPPISATSNRYIIEPIEGGGHNSWLLTDDDPHKKHLDAWIADGNTLQEWQPESEPVIEEEPADSTEEPVTEDGN